jgi:hypothetical protein
VALTNDMNIRDENTAAHRAPRDVGKETARHMTLHDHGPAILRQASTRMRRKPQPWCLSLHAHKYSVVKIRLA